MKTTKVICDKCKQDITTMYNGWQGEGSLYFKYKMGKDCGGSGDTVKYDDLCYKCCVESRESIKDWYNKK
jgi:hypothetical protein